MSALHEGPAAAHEAGSARSGRAVETAGTGWPDYTLVCFHHAGGGVSAYRDWLARPPAGARVCAVRLPGRETRLDEPPYRDMDTLLDRLTDTLAPHLDGRFAFYGHSMGALVAFALACRLTGRGGHGPEQLFLAACGSPDDRPRRRTFPADWSVDDVRGVLRRLGGTSEELLGHTGLLSLIGPTVVADFGLCDDYTAAPGVRTTSAITAFAGLDDPSVDTHSAARWAAWTDGAFELVPVPAGHLFPRAVMRGVLDRIDATMSW